MAVATDTGVFHDRFPYVRIGTGPTPLVVLPGLSLTHATPRGLTVAAYGRGFRHLAEDHTLYVVQRPHGLSSGATTRDIAAEYGPVLDQELGRFRLMGLSTGGLIAQHLALDHPTSVDGLALVVAGARMAPSGLDICTRWRALAEAGRWRELHGDLAAIAVDGPVSRWLARRLLSLSGAPSVEEAADFRITVAAVLAHDTRRRLAELRTPTLVLGGALDPFFPEAMLRATAAAIPRAALRVFPRNGHGVPKHRAGEMQAAVAGFFAASDGSGRR